MQKKYLILSILLLVLIFLIIIILTVLKSNKANNSEKLESTTGTIYETKLVTEQETGNSFTITAKLANLEKRGDKIVGNTTIGDLNYETIFYSNVSKTLTINYQNHPYTFAQQKEKVEPIFYNNINDAFNALNKYNNSNIIITYEIKDVSPKNFKDCNIKLYELLKKDKVNATELGCSTLSWIVNVYAQ